ncbi:hypothetical protein [Pseudoalteromonas piratica]|uniref:hypothetical protein n=1 Tax=Pseudoalteromonas piratica TaxID=1348114 RepID=UPI000689E072|nr:hypothetical protein [Pseudoalteromonas piratica]
MKKLIALLTVFSCELLARGGASAIPTNAKESDYVEHYCRGEIEHRLPDKTRIDCLNDTHAIEYDWGKKWHEALGQSLYYSAMTGKKAGIVLIVNPKTKERYLTRLNKAIEAHNLNVDVWTIDK